MEDIFLKFHQICCCSIEVLSGVFNGVQESAGIYFLCDEKAIGAPKNQVWKLQGKDRYIFNNGSQNGWRIGDKESLNLGDFYYKSGLDTLSWIEEMEWTNSKGTSIIVKCTDTENQKIFRKLLNFQGHFHNDKNLNALHFAAMIGELMIVKTIFEENPTLVLTKDSCGRTPLHFASQNSHWLICLFLIEFGSEKNPANKNGWTPLHYAAKSGQFSVCKLILENVSDKNPKCLAGQTPLHLAAKNGHFRISQLILENIEDKNPKTLYGETPLHFAAKSGHLKICQLLISILERKNPKNEFGETPLHFAAQNGHVSVCQLLIENIGNKNPKAYYCFGKTPLNMAVENGHTDVVNLLLSEVKADTPCNIL